MTVAASLIQNECCFALQVVQNVVFDYRDTITAEDREIILKALADLNAGLDAVAAEIRARAVR